MKQLIYKLRWFVKNQWGDPLAQKQALAILARMLGEKPSSSPPKVKPKADGEVDMFLPICKVIGPKAKTRGNYPKGYPEGAIVHWTGGHWDQSGADAMAFQRKSGMCYFYIDEKGTIFQNFPLNRWGLHAGDSKKYPSHWPEFGKYVSNRAVGIELACAGTLNSKNQPWFKRTVPADQVRVVGDKDNMQAGRYQKYTPAQEESLTRLLLALKANNPDVFDLNLVLGHDEVSGKRGIGWSRKSDPGGSLSMTMDEYRKKLISEYEKQTS